MISYSEVKAGWDRAAATDPNPAIHPLGSDIFKYAESGTIDAWGIIEQIFKHENLVTYVDGITLKVNNILEKSIIDFGCGNGRVTQPISVIFKKVYAVDFSYAMLQQIRNAEKIQPILSVDNWFGLSDLADYAFSISVFIHNSYESGVQMVKAISDNMKPGGLALLQIPIYDEPTDGAHWSDVTTWTMDQLAAACEIAGFEKVEIKTSPGKFSHESIGPNHHFLQVLKKL